MKKFGDFLWGLFFIALGTIIGLNAMGITDIDIFFDGWWTLFIIVPCFISLFKEQEKLGNLIGLTIGVALLAAAQGLLAIDMIIKLIVPGVLIAIGISIIFKGFIQSSITEKIKSVNKDNLESYCATFSEQKVSMNGVDFKGANLDAIFGSVKLDLNGVHIAEDRVIHATAIFGRIEIEVPENINVKVKSNSVFGGVSNKITHRTENAPTIYINGSGIFGGVTIR